MPEVTFRDRTRGTYRRAAPLFVRGEGAWMVDDEGERFLDLISGIGANSLGHGHPRLAAALAEQAGTLGHISNLYRHGMGEELSERLCELTCMEAVFFCNSGSEANEAALKLARKHHAEAGHPERQHFVALERGFHGRTFGSLSVTSNAAYRTPFGEGLAAKFIEPDDAAALEAALAEGPAPDVVTLAKPIGAGLPIGATLARGPFARTLVPGDHGSTFGGGPFACRAALCVLDELDGGLQQHVIDVGATLAAGLDRLVARHPALTERRGLGLMQGVVAPGRAAEITGGLFDAGVLTCTAQGDVVRFLPPYIVTLEDLAEGLSRLDRVLTDLPSDPS